MPYAMLTWLGGGEPRDVGERHERSSYALAGVVVAANAALAAAVATAAVAAATRWPLAAAVPLGLLFGLLVGAVTRAVATGEPRGRRGLWGRAAVALAVGAVVGELASTLLFSGAIDRRIDEQSVLGATAAPAVAQASADLDGATAARSALDAAVEEARDRRDESLVVARCEYNPSPACPQTRITGVPGSGPETRTANEQLAGAQAELDSALAARDQRAAGLDAAVAAAGQNLAQARAAAVADADRGLGARWVAMSGYSLGDAGALLLRLAATAFFAVLTLLPLILRLWRGETGQDRLLAARATRERAGLEADTAIAVKQAEVRATAEALWAEQQLANARLAVQAQNEIDREHHRRRVAQATGASAPPLAAESLEDDVYLPIAAAAHAASLAAAEPPAVEAPPAAKALPAPAPPAAKALPAPAPPAAEAPPAPAKPGRPQPIPTIPAVTRAAARWVRPLVPPIVSRVIDTTTQPLRAARQAFEEVEEITFSFRRVHRVTLRSEEPVAGAPAAPHGVDAAPPAPGRVDAAPPAPDWVDAEFERPSQTAGQGSSTPIGHPATAARGVAGRGPSGQLGAGPDQRELHGGDGPRELDGRDGPRELPPGP